MHDESKSPFRGLQHLQVASVETDLILPPSRNTFNLKGNDWAASHSLKLCMQRHWNTSGSPNFAAKMETRKPEVP
jgi:plasmid maintenance system killer protein